MQVKIRISEEPGCEETEVLVRCREMDEEVLRLLARLRVLDAKLTGERNGATCLLDAGQVLYADTADKRTFLYTAEGVYETALRLYELEEQLAARDFIRAGKSVQMCIRDRRVSQSQAKQPPRFSAAKKTCGAPAASMTATA